MTKRRYEFELPYVVPSYMVGIAVSKLVAEHIWNKLPIPLCEKINHASQNWGAFEISKEDCDAIDDKTWAHIAEELGLQWTKLD